MYFKLKLINDCCPENYLDKSQHIPCPKRIMARQVGYLDVVNAGEPVAQFMNEQFEIAKGQDAQDAPQDATLDRSPDRSIEESSYDVYE